MFGDVWHSCGRFEAYKRTNWLDPVPKRDECAEHTVTRGREKGKKLTLCFCSEDLCNN